MSLEKNINAFIANLYLNGLPVVLNQQRLQQRLQETRITGRARLDAETGLADPRETSFITLADHEDDEPLSLKFVPHGSHYTVSIALEGEFDGARLSIESKTHNLLASKSAGSEFFSIRTVRVAKALLSDIASGPAYIELCSEPNNKPLYRNVEAEMSTFLNVDPNVSGHNAFNNKPAIFVIRVLK
jgi:hypothetical protein